MKLFISFFSLLLLTSVFSYGDTNQTKPADTITWAMAEDWSPIFYKDKQSDMGFSGLWPDIIRELFINRMNLKVEVHQLPWTRAQAGVRQGTLDFMITLPTEERKKYALISDASIMDFTMQVYTYAGHPKLEEIKKIRNVQDIKRLGLIPVTNFGNGWHKENIDSFGINTHYVKQEESLPKFLALKRADIMIDSPLTMNREIREQDLENQIVLTDVVFGHTRFHLMVSKKSPFASRMDQINYILKEMTDDGTIDRIKQKYLKLK